MDETTQIISLLFEVLQGGLTPVLAIAVIVLYRDNKRLLNMLLDIQATNAAHREQIKAQIIDAFRAETVNMQIREWREQPRGEK